ncbi:hypothetical protein ACFQRK_21110 [Parapedobacter sp. GCM10030251]|uniref:hypothetical protein n=1 Tax=Parapedobacter sp. GCM10030251 TaxID=3273419 RepID=UPI00360AF9FD
MNNTFSTRRFGLLLRKQWIENWKVYLASSAILFGCISLFYILNIVSDNFFQRDSHHITGMDAYTYFRFSSLRFREGILALSGIGYITLLSGHYYSRLSKPATGIQELTLPVSVTEKLLGGLVFGSLLTIFTFIAVCLVTDTAFVAALRVIYSDVTFDNKAVELSQVNYGDGQAGFKYYYQVLDVKSRTILLLFAFLLSSVFTLGSIYFRRFPFIKTGFFVVALISSLTATQEFLNKMLLKDRVEINHFAANGYPEVFFIMFLITLIGSLWAATYFRLKEKEV